MGLRVLCLKVGCLLECFQSGSGLGTPTSVGVCPSQRLALLSDESGHVEFCGRGGCREHCRPNGRVKVSVN